MAEFLAGQCCVVLFSSKRCRSQPNCVQRSACLVLPVHVWVMTMEMCQAVAWTHRVPGLWCTRHGSRTPRWVFPPVFIHVVPARCEPSTGCDDLVWPVDYLEMVRCRVGLPRPRLCQYRCSTVSILPELPPRIVHVNSEAYRGYPRYFPSPKRHCRPAPLRRLL